MKTKTAVSLFIVVTFLISSCASSAEPEGRCGDGVCDEAEQKKPSLCPEDCVQLPPEEDEQEEATATVESGEWKASVLWDCDLEFPDGYDKWSYKLDYDFKVGADDKLSGSGTGTPTRAECVREGCECTLSIKELKVNVGGLKQGDYFSIELTPQYSMTECLTCPEVGTSCGSIEQVYACTCVGGPLDVTLEAQEGAFRSFECNTMGYIGVVHGNTTLSKK